MSRTTSKRALLGVFFGVISLLTMSSVGYAQTGDAAAGTGGGTGFEYLDAPAQQDECPVFPFLEVSSDRFVLNHTGTYEAVDVNGQLLALYVGPTVMEIRVGPHLISPEGTYLCVEESGLEVPVPLPVPILSATVQGETRDPLTNQVTGSVSCSALNPTAVNGYTRRGAEAVTFTFTNANCQINGNVPDAPGTTTVDNVRHVVDGTLTPCVPLLPVCGAPPEPDPSGFLVTTYEAAGPSPV